MIHLHPATLRRMTVGVALFLSATRLVAQTNDESHLIMGVSAGWIGAAGLWDIPQQVIKSTFDQPDIWHLHREIRSNITISGYGTYFPGPHFGWTGEFTYLGLGTTDACTVVQSGGDISLGVACAALQGDERSASVTTVQGGGVVRPWSRTSIQPYIKGLVGIAFTPSSTVEMTSIYGSIGDTLLTLNVYSDDHWAELRPSWSLAAGLATAPSSGYQLRVEVRETWLALSEVTGADPTGQGFVPPTRSVFKGFPSLMVAFDIVLEKRHGRRY